MQPQRASHCSSVGKLPRTASSTLAGGAASIRLGYASTKPSASSLRASSAATSAGQREGSSSMGCTSGCAAASVSMAKRVWASHSPPRLTDADAPPVPAPL